MGYTLKPRHRAVSDFDAGGFSWPWMLDAGVGLPLGYGKAFVPGQYVARNRKDGLCVSANDGARISASEAKQMAQIARWVADLQDSLYAEWEKMPASEQQRMRDDRTRLYTLPVRRDFVEETRAFADWAEKSGGFRVW